MLEEYADAIADVRGQTQRPVGRMTISAPMGLGELRLNTFVLEFLAQSPEIEIELNLTGRARDAEQLAWLLRTSNALVNALRPRLGGSGS
ncbi:DNA-binding transcriptional LysR family regulator [Paraburkholderia youngii]|uniref:hypothetical protein n=1 Tax=Paraburkholderia youngii TaxID=2782701 RepID=UPI003D1D3630